ncbi:MAG: hypothetical protein M3P46_03980 [Actinomycetota bacterium]|nr:hypothetical protein [Actinomycetota bacterium]
MATAWIVPTGTDHVAEASDGDYLLRRSSGSPGQYEVGAVSAAGSGAGSGTCTWAGTVNAGLLPLLPEVQEPTVAPDQERVLTAVRGVVTAETHRGG